MTSTPTPAALLPCPFCGSTNAFVQNAGWQANTFIRCRGCKTTFALDNGTPRSHDDSVAAWNRRPSPPPSGDVEARLRTWAAGAGLGSGEPVLTEAADLLASQAQTIEITERATANGYFRAVEAETALTQERELRKAAERHLRTIVATDDAFRSSISPKADKDLLTIACDAARIFLNANDQGTNDGR